jgi:hypothetical protein
MTRAALVLTLCLAAGAAQAEIRQFSYDPANADTRAAAGPVTLMINQTLFSTRVLKMRSTEAKATVDLARSGDGPGGAVGRDAPGREIYRILPTNDGPAFTAALCPGSKRSWLALTAVKYGRNVQAVVFGDDPSGGPVKRCRTLEFAFHGEWRLPPGAAPEIEPIAPPDFPN